MTSGAIAATNGPDKDGDRPWPTLAPGSGGHLQDLLDDGTTMPDGPYNVLLLEDIRAVADRLRGILDTWSEGRLLPVCRTVAEAIAAIGTTRVDILIADLQLPDGLGIDAIRALKAKEPGAQAIVMSVLNDGPVVLEAIRAGATGYVVKDDESIGVLAAIEMMLEGKSPMSATIARLIVESMQAAPEAAPVDPPDEPEISLTARERDVLTMISRGFSFREVAEMLGISAQTVPVHARNIYRKLEATTKTEAVFLAHQRGLIDL
ncbi:LuxR C-terminal-related transcriptional regulator [Nioella nitratireducens]|uniref:LuxR C-terminal-related transcriptional regulator n=1 Tax=Nioella nitratireducens TaxID=1287720 RepID=UPI0018F40D52|nr:response regulator transcription factor [Nioella nitratireducens]